MWCIFPTYVWAHWIVGFIAIEPVKRYTKQIINKPNGWSVVLSSGSHPAILAGQKQSFLLFMNFIFGSQF